jgi:HlyD family secretion protein
MRIRGTLIAAAGTLAGVAFVAWAFAPRPVAVETAVVERGRFEAAIEEDGRTRLKDRYAISAPTAARLERIRLREGDRVAAGDPVAVLTPVMPAMVDERSRSEAQARLRAAEASMDLAAARIGRARGAAEQAQLELQRTERLADEGFLPSARLDAARIAREGAQRELDAALAEQEVARHHRELAAAALAPVRSAGGAPFVLRSPVAGVVIRVPQPSEATVAAGAVLLELGDPSRLEVVAQLLTIEAIQARPGARVSIERWGGPPLEGRVARVEPGAFTKVSALGIEEQRVNVVIEVGPQAPDAWRSVGDGFRVTARIITADVPDSVLLPVGAVFPHGDGAMATYRIESGRARLRSVELAGRNPTHAAIRQGVEVGDAVVIYPPPALREGDRVQARRP